MTDARRTKCLAACYAAAIFLGAFLVFQVQPVVGRAILPWFGGSPAVWTTCMLFFQVVLLGGYVYAHVLVRYLAPRWQAVVHLGLLVASLIALPIAPEASWKPTTADDPTWHILLLLAANVGLPYFLLSSTGPLVQAWFGRAFPGRSPYRLYALSNAGSLLALLSYPLVVEPALGLRWQAAAWTLGFCGFALIGGYLAARLWRPEMNGAPDDAARERLDLEATAPTWSLRLVWLALPALASVMLLATTNHVCQDVAVIPFLWVAPLALYLLSFILCFDSSRWYVARFWAFAAVASILAASALAVLKVTDHLVFEVGVYFSALFSTCMVCHGELVRRKPGAAYLTEFYLMCSAGGALGGIIVAILCPVAFSTYAEFPLVLVAGYVLAAGVIVSQPRFLLWPRGSAVALGGMAVLAVGLVGVAKVQLATIGSAKLAATRSFYGVLHVDDVDAADDEKRGRVLFHGRVAHGYQFLAPERRDWPTMYYDRASGVGVALAEARRGGAGEARPLRVGAIGLGVGVIATYAEPGDLFRFYEINPDVEMLARRHFSFLADCRGEAEVAIGDARRTMEEEPPMRYDVLVLDAFSGDAIPTHLLTREAFDVYRRHLAADGVIAVHISNRHVDLAPVIDNLAKAFQYQTVEVQSKTDPSRGATAAQWVMLSRDARFIARVSLHATANQLAATRRVPLWTDEYSNLWQLLK